MTLDQELTLVTSKPERKTYFVYYNEWDGAIVTVAHHELPNLAYPYIITSDETAKAILRGDVNESNFIVTFGADNTLTLAVRDNVVRLRGSESKLHSISNKFVPNWDIKIKVYSGNNKLVVEINSESIRKLSDMTFNKKIEVNNSTDMSLYIVQNNNPDFLLYKLVIDPVELLTSGNVVYDISELKKYISFKDIGFLTRRIFKNYFFEVSTDSLDVIQHSLIKNRSFVQRNVKHDLEKSHILIEQRGNTATFKTSLSKNDLEELGLYEEHMWLYVTGKTTDEFYGRIQLNLRDLKTKKYTEITISDSLYDCNILHKKHKVLFSIRKI